MNVFQGVQGFQFETIEIRHHRSSSDDEFHDGKISTISFNIVSVSSLHANRIRNSWHDKSRPPKRMKRNQTMWWNVYLIKYIITFCGFHAIDLFFSEDEKKTVRCMLCQGIDFINWRFMKKIFIATKQWKTNGWSYRSGRNEIFGENTLVLWFVVVAGYRSNTRNQMLENVSTKEK